MSVGPLESVFLPLESDDPQSVVGYRLAARLGAGGMGRVYLSYTPGGRPVAIKVIRPELSEDPEFRRRFRREVQAAQQVQGLYTAPVVDFDTEGRQPWLATAYVPGPSLTAAVAEHGPLPVSSVLLLAAGIGEALQAIHRAGIVHRDLKPSNVLLGGDGPRVIDFGIARAADATALTASGVTIGTPAFMAPEQAAGGQVGTATDVFALGQVAAFAAMGSPAYGEGPSHAVLYRIVHEEPDLRGLPDELRPLVMACLAREPGDRPEPREIIERCRAASTDTRLRGPLDWLPAGLADTVTERIAAEPPQPPPPPPTHPPTATGTPPPVSPPVPSAPPTVPATASATAPPTTFGGPYTGPTHAPVRHTATGIAHGSPPPKTEKKSRKVVLLAVVLAALLLVPLTSFVSYQLFSDDDSSGGQGKNASGQRDTPPGDRSDTSDKSDKKEPAPAEESSPEAPVAPTAVDYEGVDLTSGYSLRLADAPVTPLDHSNDDDLSFVDSTLFAESSSQLVLLGPTEEGSLETCSTVTRYAPYIEADDLSPGDEMCLTSKTGHIALVTFQGRSSESDPSDYITLDLRVWRDAAEL